MNVDVLRDHVIGKRHYRSMKVDREKLSMESDTIHMTFSSDCPVARWWGVEVLSHKPECMRLDRWRQGAPYLMDHCMSDQRGIIMDGDFRPPFLDGNVKYSANDPGQTLKRDVVDGIRPYTSVGYEIHMMREMTPEEMSPEMKDLCLQYGIKCYDVNDWEPLEGSSVALGANPVVGARSIEYRDGLDDTKILELIARAKEDGQQNNSNPSITTNERGSEMTEPKTKEQLEQESAQRKVDIEAIGKKYESRIVGGQSAMQQLVKDAIELERSVELFRGDIFTRINDGEPLETPGSFLDLTPRQKREYSISRALLGLIDGRSTGLEKECSDTIAKNTYGDGTPVGPAKRGLYVPYDIQRRDVGFSSGMNPAVERELSRILARNGMSMRDLKASSPAAGGYLVGTEHRPQDMIELLYNRLIQGVRRLSGLSSNVQIPKMTGGATVTLASEEGTDYGETAQVFDQIELTPHDIGGYVEVTRRLLIQASPDVDSLISYDLMNQLALRMNYLMLYGSGLVGQPLGIFNTPNIGIVNGVDMSWPSLLEFLSDIGRSNVAGVLQWLMNSTTQVLLMGRAKEAGYPVYLMGEDGRSAGKDAQISEQIADGDLSLAKMDEVIVGEFGIMEILYDRTTHSANGGLRIAAYHSMDSALRHPGAISFADAVS